MYHALNVSMHTILVPCTEEALTYVEWLKMVLVNFELIAYAR